MAEFIVQLAKLASRTQQVTPMTGLVPSLATPAAGAIGILTSRSLDKRVEDLVLPNHLRMPLN